MPEEPRTNTKKVTFDEAWTNFWNETVENPDEYLLNWLKKNIIEYYEPIRLIIMDDKLNDRIADEKIKLFFAERGLVNLRGKASKNAKIVSEKDKSRINTNYETEVSAIELSADDHNTTTNIRYWKISPGERAFLWDKCKKNNIILLGWCHDTDWRAKFGDLTKNPDKELLIRVLKEEYPIKVLFCWNNVHLNKSPELLSFLKKAQFEQLWDDVEYSNYTTEVALQHLKQCNISLDLNKFSDKKGNEYADSILAAVKTMKIDWDDNVKINKINDKTIHVDYGNNYAKITLDKNKKNKKKAILKFNDMEEIDSLVVKDENGMTNIYRYTENQIKHWSEIIKDFLEIKPKDMVIVYDKDFHINALAEVEGKYDFNKQIEYPHTKAVRWIKVFTPPLNIKPLEKELVTNLSFNRTVIPLTKKDWDIIYNYAKGLGIIKEKSEEKTTSDEILKNLFNQARIELGSNKKLILDDVLSKMKQIAEAKGQYLSSNWENVANEKIKNEWARDKPGTK